MLQQLTFVGFISLVWTIIVQGNVDKMSDYLTAGELGGFWRAVLSASDDGLVDFIQYFALSPLNIFPDADGCKSLCPGSLYTLAEKTSKRPWLLRSFLGNEGCVAAIMESCDIGGWLLDLGFGDITLIPVVKKGNSAKKRSKARNLSMARLSWLSPTHPELRRWLSNMSRGFLEDQIAQRAVDWAAIISKGSIESRRISDVLVGVIHKSISGGSTSFMGIVHYLSIALQEARCIRADVKRVIEAGLKALSRNVSHKDILSFIKYVISQGTPTQAVFDAALQSLRSLQDPWHRIARLSVDLIIIWIQRYRVSPLTEKILWYVPYLVDEHVAELMIGISTVVEAAKETLLQIFHAYPFILCKAIRSKHSAQHLFQNAEMLLWCNGIQALLPDDPRLNDARKVPRLLGNDPYNNYVCSRLLEMQVSGKYYAISVDSHFPENRLSPGTLSLMIRGDPNSCTTGDLKSKYGILPGFVIMPSNERHLLFPILNYSLLRFGRPAFLLAPDFCAAIAGGKKKLRDYFYKKSTRGFCQRRSWKSPPSFIKVCMTGHNILRKGGLNGIPKDKWCALISGTPIEQTDKSDKALANLVGSLKIDS
jgi:hypothetical protein